MEDITIIIKTFIRTKCLERLLDSIKIYANKCYIIVCDDSKDANNNKEKILKKYNDLKINYIVTEENIGLSKGRNILVENVKTKYFLLCDDDFVFKKFTNLSVAKDLIEKNNFDILGGLCLHAYRINYGTKSEKIQLFMRSFQKIFNSYRKVGYKGKIEIQNNEINIDIKKLKYNSKVINDTDICENFFIAKTDSVKKVMWYDKLKLNEHEDFFIRAKKTKLIIGVTPMFKVLHFPETYSSFSNYRKINYYKYVLENNNINKLKIYRNNVGVIQTYSLNNKGEILEEQSYTNNILGRFKKFYYEKIK